MGKLLEVAGYTLNPDLINPLMQLRVKEIGLNVADKVKFVELGDCR